MVNGVCAVGFAEEYCVSKVRQTHWSFPGDSDLVSCAFLPPVRLYSDANYHHSFHRALLLRIFQCSCYYEKVLFLQLDMICDQ
ncbi:predicted protein [Plenodomus lingam JN3]|uniref:Predicted protein n=1 Tax=Leptosphaeria maculans (strain JN3 / isolate v23.1.3 / race Av1-4-5-6-7-8) TaxID=985895 RepID=E4ZT16_LEPMJ|nr:predicted protein [Plenodomus lingam JN3]CBX94447.1 predicted protein [Plenodomus lingam JN3]